MNDIIKNGFIGVIILEGIAWIGRNLSIVFGILFALAAARVFLYPFLNSDINHSEMQNIAHNMVSFEYELVDDQITAHVKNPTNILLADASITCGDHYFFIGDVLPSQEFVTDLDTKNQNCSFDYDVQKGDTQRNGVHVRG